MYEAGGTGSSSTPVIGPFEECDAKSPQGGVPSDAGPDDSAADYGDIKGPGQRGKAARVGQFSGGSRPIEARWDWCLQEGGRQSGTAGFSRC